MFHPAKLSFCNPAPTPWLYHHVGGGRKRFYPEPAVAQEVVGSGLNLGFLVMENQGTGQALEMNSDWSQLCGKGLAGKAMLLHV